MISHPTNSPPKHNNTFDKQGGDSTSNEYYHLTEEQLDILEHVTGKHNDLNEIQGGSAGEYYHLTSAEHTVVENTSGVNTGDQESSDFDHDQLQNTHNLTTDINHNSVDGIQGGDSTANEHYHLTEDQVTIVDNTSGVNTGDQVASDFNHNDLSNISGGAPGDYQHLTAEEKTQALKGTDFLVVQVFS
jgi:hypothetical protein